MAEHPTTWILNPTTLGPDQHGITWGLGVRDRVFVVYRAEPHDQPGTSTHRELDDALTALPSDIATFLRSHGAEMIAWAVGLDADLARPPAEPERPGTGGGPRRGGPPAASSWLSDPRPACVARVVAS